MAKTRQTLRDFFTSIDKPEVDKIDFAISTDNSGEDRSVAVGSNIDLSVDPNSGLGLLGEEDRAILGEFLNFIQKEEMLVSDQVTQVSCRQQQRVQMEPCKLDLIRSC